jgi:hypothetical protein
VPARFCEVPAGMIPNGWPEPVPTANAVSSIRSFASDSSSGQLRTDIAVGQNFKRTEQVGVGLLRGDLQADRQSGMRPQPQRLQPSTPH